MAVAQEGIKKLLPKLLKKGSTYALAAYGGYELGELTNNEQKIIYVSTENKNENQGNYQNKEGTWIILVTLIPFALIVLLIVACFWIYKWKANSMKGSSDRNNHIKLEEI